MMPLSNPLIELITQAKRRPNIQAFRNPPVPAQNKKRKGAKKKSAQRKNRSAQFQSTNRNIKSDG